jgi:hypothetical protein
MKNISEIYIYMIVDKIYLTYQNKIFLNGKFNDLLDPHIFEFLF